MSKSRPQPKGDHPSRHVSEGPRTSKFGRKEVMPTAKSMLEYDRQRNRLQLDGQYHGAPPIGQELIAVRFILPQEHLLPSGLDHPAAFNGIRSTHQVYITPRAPNVLELHGSSVAQLREATQAVNWALHDMRLSNDHHATRFIVQPPCRALSTDCIKYAIGCRPQFAQLNRTESNVSVLNGQMGILSGEMAKESETLMSLQKGMEMRVNFGHILVRQKKKGTGE